MIRRAIITIPVEYDDDRLDTPDLITSYLDETIRAGQETNMFDRCGPLTFGDSRLQHVEDLTTTTVTTRTLTTITTTRGCPCADCRAARKKATTP